jgi:pyrroline-5-carboxylate reductase
MAGAMVDGWRRAGVDLSDVTVIRPSGTPVDGLRTVTGYPDGAAPRLVLLGFKPQKLDEVVPALAPRLSGQTILVSLLAGVSAETLRARFPSAGPVVRAMPNLGVSERQGVTGLYSGDEDANARRTVEELMSVIGLAPWCANETELGALGAVAAAGPAYVARFAAAMALGGQALGLSAELARRIADQTLIGTAALAAKGEAMESIARRVASPRGTTEQGLMVLDAPDGLQPLVDRMLQAAVRRGRELAEEAAGRG